MRHGRLLVPGVAPDQFRFACRPKSWKLWLERSFSVSPNELATNRMDALRLLRLAAFATACRWLAQRLSRPHRRPSSSGELARSPGRISSCGCPAISAEPARMAVDGAARVLRSHSHVRSNLRGFTTSSPILLPPVAAVQKAMDTTRVMKRSPRRDRRFAGKVSRTIDHHHAHRRYRLTDKELQTSLRYRGLWLNGSGSFALKRAKLCISRSPPLTKPAPVQTCPRMRRLTIFGHLTPRARLLRSLRCSIAARRARAVSAKGSDGPFAVHKGMGLVSQVFNRGSGTLDGQ
jgi:hypothetical protein